MMTNELETDIYATLCIKMFRLGLQLGNRNV